MPGLNIRILGQNLHRRGNEKGAKRRVKSLQCQSSSSSSKMSLQRHFELRPLS